MMAVIIIIAELPHTSNLPHLPLHPTRARTPRATHVNSLTHRCTAVRRRNRTQGLSSPSAVTHRASSQRPLRHTNPLEIRFKPTFYYTSTFYHLTTPPLQGRLEAVWNCMGTTVLALVIVSPRSP